MSGFFGVISKQSCVNEVYYGTDYHSHLGTLYQNRVLSMKSIMVLIIIHI